LPVGRPTTANIIHPYFRQYSTGVTMSRNLLLCTVTLLLLFTFCADSQTWQWSHPLPQGDVLWNGGLLQNGTVWASTHSGCVLWSHDGGASWTIHAPDPAVRLEDVVFVDADNGWALGDHGAILHTTDGGRSWQEQYRREPRYFQDIAAADANTAWAVGTYYRPENGIAFAVRTTDGGNTWLEQEIDHPPMLYCVDFLDSQEGWASGREALLHTTDGGQSWNTISYCCTLALGLQFTSPQVGWGMSFYGVHLTTDGGLTWTLKWDTDPYYADMHFVNDSTGWIVRSSGEIYKTSDFGDSWVYQPSGVDVGFSAIEFANADTGWLFGGAGIILNTSDGGDHWEARTGDPSLSSAYLSDVRFADDHNGWAVGLVGGTGLIMHTSDGGLTWVSSPFVESPYLYCMDVLDSLNLWIGGASIWNSTDGGQSWSLSSAPQLGPWFHLIAVNPQVIFASSLYFLVRTLDGGETWEDYYIGDDLDPCDISFVDENNGWMAQCYGEAPGYIRRTTDGGATWTVQLEHEWPMTVVSFVDANNGWATGWGDSVYHTTDGGESWSAQYSGMSLDPTAMQFVDNQTGWVMNSYEGFVYTTDGGNTWIGNPVPTFNRMWGGHATDIEHVWVVGTSATILRFNGHGSGTTGPPPSVPQVFSLRAYPNPFNPATTIQFDLPAMGPVSLAVYDLSGRLVQTLFSGRGVPGSHSVVFDGRTLASGMYFVNLQAAGFSRTTKIVLLK
jgi:photosystem II stability/assembly factor-like uncharacterized protein